MFDLDEDDMLDIPVHIVPCRGRAGRPDTDYFESFTEKELDLLAPLAPGDSQEMAQYSAPNPETITRLEQRIEAARRLKYGS